MSSRQPSSSPSPARLEAFSDGVIAVIITIMVLELKLPPPHRGPAGLYAVLPTLLVYLLSFSFTGVWWVNHHALIHRLHLVDSFVLYANLLFLFTLSLLPFFTNYVLDNGMDAFSVALYAAALILTGAAFGLLRIAVNRILCLHHELGLQDIATQRKHFVSLGIYLIAIPMAFWHPRIALADLALVTVLWIVPSFGIDSSSIGTQSSSLQDPPGPQSTPQVNQP
jgi:uncharacterized membrane protein